MVRILASSVVGAVFLSSFASAAPAKWKRQDSDSALGEEVAVSAPFGVPLSDTVELARQLATATGADAAAVTPFDAAAAPPESTTVDSAGQTWVMSAYTAVQSDGSVVTSTLSSILAPEPTVPPAVVAPPPPVELPPSSAGLELPLFGSGSVGWQANYNDCVQVCMVKHAPPPSVWKPTFTGHIGTPTIGAVTGSENIIGGGIGGGIVSPYKVVVAPRQGVFRFVPPFIQVPVGETVHFSWGANNHTVTESSITSPCTKNEPPAFISGLQLKDFNFQVKVNSTDPKFFYCSVPGHCEKGMFGIINPPVDPQSASSIGAMFPIWTSNSIDLKNAWDYVEKQIPTGSSFHTWGNDFSVANIENKFHLPIATSVLYFRLLAALNPTAFNEQGVFNPTEDLRIPPDVPQILLATANINSTSPDASTPGASDAAGAVVTSVPQSSARSLSASGLGAALVAAFAGFLLL